MMLLHLFRVKNNDATELPRDHKNNVLKRPKTALKFEKAKFE